MQNADCKMQNAECKMQNMEGFRTKFENHTLNNFIQLG